MTDVNFDGYDDLFILKRVGGAKANHFYSIWLWDEKERKFAEQPELAPNLVIDRKNKRLLSVEAYTAAEKGYKIYQFEDGAFQLKHQLIWRIDRNGNSDKEAYSFQEFAWEDQKMILEKEWIVIDSNTIEAEEAYQRDYDEKSFWKLRDLSWYRSDYGNNLGFFDSEGNEIFLEMDID